MRTRYAATNTEKRLEYIKNIDEAHAHGARIEEACNSIHLPPRTYYTWKEELAATGTSVDKRPSAVHPEPANKITPEERQNILDYVHSEEYADMTPAEIVPALADKGIYVCSESTLYRILHEEQEDRRRGLRKTPEGPKTPRTWVAAGPNQVWVWDITYLPTKVKGMYFYLYLFTDIWSRYIVGGEVYLEQSGDLARELMQRILIDNHIDLNSPPVLHSDNGSPMKAQVFYELLAEYGIRPSHSRPAVSNDNAYAESAFSTLKGRPDYPREFETLEQARAWTKEFITWARQQHHHSGINYLTPEQRHYGKGPEILEKRHHVYEAAKEAHPERWNGRKTRNCDLEQEVYLNPSKEKREALMNRRRARNKSAG